jgi:hypothetical protein
MHLKIISKYSHLHCKISEESKYVNIIFKMLMDIGEIKKNKNYKLIKF